MKSVPSPVVHGRINCLSAGTPMCSKVEKRRWEAHGFAAPGGASATSHIYIYIYIYVCIQCILTILYTHAPTSSLVHCLNRPCTSFQLPRPLDPEVGDDSLLAGTFPISSCFHTRESSNISCSQLIHRSEIIIYSTKSIQRHFHPDILHLHADVV